MFFATILVCSAMSLPDNKGLCTLQTSVWSTQSRPVFSSVKDCVDNSQLWIATQWPYIKLPEGNYQVEVYCNEIKGD